MSRQYTGGYFLHNEPLVRTDGRYNHTAADLSHLSEYTIEAVNHIQETPWAINQFVLKVITEFHALGLNVTSDDEVILRFEKPEDPAANGALWVPKERYEAMTTDEREEHRQESARKRELFRSALGEHHLLMQLIELSKEMSEFDQFYFPHNMDFRTRIYPIPTTLNPQANDVSKGLLRFARPTRLETEGVYWMAFTVATHWGEDKLHPDDRVQWAYDNMADLCLYVDDPINNRGWLKADKPFQFLAVAYEWVWAFRTGHPEQFLSYLPGNLDGSCNGAQHLSILARDLVGATATNCRNVPDRHDLYMAVADRVWEQVQKDIIDGHPMAIKWRSKLETESGRRKVVKRAVMTVPYGVTERGIAEFMISDKHVDPGRDKWDQAKYMRDLILAAVGETLNRGREIQMWFMECAMICAEAGVPLAWDTPAGSKVTQAYRNLIQRRVRTFDSRFYLYEEPEDGEDAHDFLMRVGMDKGKMATAAPPNVVHSCDASHLQITVCRMYEVGIKDFSMIHDSFGCPFAKVGVMRDILRQTVVDMYADDYLARWKESVERYSGLRMPEPPATGDFDLQEILESVYFFS